MNEPTLSCVESINQGKEEIYQVPWSKVNTYSEYIPPLCKGKICTVVELPWPWQWQMELREEDHP